MRPRDFKCMRHIHTLLNDECDGIMSTGYAMTYNKYVIDFCETKGDKEAFAGLLHQFCGVTHPNEASELFAALN